MTNRAADGRMRLARVTQVTYADACGASVDRTPCNARDIGVPTPDSLPHLSARRGVAGVKRRGREGVRGRHKGLSTAARAEGRSRRSSWRAATHAAESVGRRFRGPAVARRGARRPAARGRRQPVSAPRRGRPRARIPLRKKAAAMPPRIRRPGGAVRRPASGGGAPVSAAQRVLAAVAG